ncbi:hypothetical protein THASP1DRAFT_27314 [Thamnocephalis sphaerospora]|uniref:SRR1-like domain-containing protein n=1 Tax=Thamnocephalis sphaerospora TaxID=78915 RepID=A0A4P9XZI6_9FUNG|nr:hypothetical protein THASP1DRAFT_27314 [Thamnocephalis sphaerospora]|eukprot:RKP10890.1 hypothetical protein THASP1DRAFT_27314 [Thamnocephalis sphaerospora]
MNTKLPCPVHGFHTIASPVKQHRTVGSPPSVIPYPVLIPEHAAARGKGSTSPGRARAANLLQAGWPISPLAEGGCTADNEDRVRIAVRYAIDNGLNTVDLGASFSSSDHERIRVLPAEIGELRHLTILPDLNHVVDHQAHHVCASERRTPAESAGLQLFLGFNMLTDLPMEFYDLQNLTVLGLQNNRLSELSFRIGQLVNLQRLNIGGNQLDLVPGEILLLPKLRELTVRPNPLQPPPSRADDGFTVVVSRRRGRRHNASRNSKAAGGLGAVRGHKNGGNGTGFNRQTGAIDEDESEEALEQRVNRTAKRVAEYREELEQSPVYRHICALLEMEMGHSLPTAMVAYGLGTFTSSREACRQLALCQLLSDRLNLHTGSVAGFDPMWSTADRRVFSRLGFVCEERNDRGARQLEQCVLMYMPHCPRGLYANVLAANWAPERFRHLVILGNRLESYVERLSSAKLNEYMPHHACSMMHAHDIQLAHFDESQLGQHDACAAESLHESINTSISRDDHQIEADQRAFSDLGLHWPKWDTLPDAADAIWAARTPPRLDDLQDGSTESGDPEVL